MREIVRVAAFKRDVKKLQRQGKDIRALLNIFDILANDGPIPLRYRDHALKGNWQGCRELHIESDWLLIYEIVDNTLYLERTGSHAELFNS